MGMTLISVVLLVESAYHSFAVAGMVTAALALGQALMSAAVSGRVDRLGQRRGALPVLGLHALGLAALLGACLLGAPAVLAVVFAALAGACAIPVGPMVRARWAHVTKTEEQRRLAFAVESVLDELVFVLGPVGSAMLALSSPAGGLAAALVFTVLGGFLLLRQGSTEPPAALEVTGKFLTKRLLGVYAGFVAAGAFLTGVDVVTVARADGHGVAGSLALGCLALGSLVAALVHGRVNWKAPAHHLWMRALMALMVAGLVPLATTTLTTTALALVVVGVTVSPFFISGYHLLHSWAPAGRTTQVMAMGGASATLGAALGSLVVGLVVDASPVHAFFAPLALVVAGVLVCLALGQRPDVMGGVRAAL
jgi:MFS family permease